MGVQRSQQGLGFDLLEHALSAANDSCIEAPLIANDLEDKSGLLNEPWVQTYVSFALNDHLRLRYKKPEALFVTFETNVLWIDYSHEKNYESQNLTPKMRFDIAVWTKSEQSIYALMEIKHQPTMPYWSYMGDMFKLSQALDRWPKIKCGLLIFGIQKTKQDSLNPKDKAESILEVIKRELPNRRINYKLEDNSQDTSWLGILLRR